MSLKAGPKAAVSLEPLDLSMLPAKRDYRRIAAFAQEFLRVPKGAGALGPFRLRPWQRDRIVKTYYPPTGSRPRQGVVSMPRGNGKSGLAAVLALYGLLADEVPGAQVLVVASDERQARIIFNSARRMISLDERLAEQVQVFQDRLYVPRTDSVMMPLPAEPGALQGYDPTLMIVDELHVVNRAVWEAVSLASGKREESLTLAISTPADSVDSVMWSLVEYGRQNPDDKSFRLIEYAADDGCDLYDRAQWQQANPALGDFLYADAIESTIRTSSEAAVRRYRLGQWAGRKDQWIPWGKWETLANADRAIDPDEPVILAFDGSASGDSTALVGCTLEGNHIWPIAIWEHPEDNPRWRVPRNEVTAAVSMCFEQLNVTELACDPWGWRSEMDQWAADYGQRVVEYNTGYRKRMAPATDRFYASVMTGDLSHDGDADLARHVNNTVAKSTPMGDIVVKDKRSSSKKIDAAVAAIVAHDRAAWHRANPPKKRRVASHKG
jgi:phage terminase large subunit-like protein